VAEEDVVAQCSLGLHPTRYYADSSMNQALLALVILAAPLTGQDYTRLRELMVRSQIEARGMRNPEVLAVMRAVPRHLFVPLSFRLPPTTTGRCPSAMARPSPSPPSSL
jgi:hypothetical protein